MDTSEVISTWAKKYEEGEASLTESFAAIRAFASDNHLILPLDWDYPFREVLSGKHGKITRDELDYLLTMPKKIKYVEDKPNAKTIWATIDRSRQADWTVRIREIHKMAQFRDDRVDRQLIEIAIHDKSKLPCNLAAQYANMRGLRDHAGNEFPSRTPHRCMPEQRKVMRYLEDVRRHFAKRDYVPTIEQVVRCFRKANTKLYNQIEGSIYIPGRPDVVNNWFRPYIQKAGIKYLD